MKQTHSRYLFEGINTMSKQADLFNDGSEEDKPLFEESINDTEEDKRLKTLRIPTKYVVEWYSEENRGAILTSKGFINLTFLRWLVKQATTEDLKWINIEEFSREKEAEIIKNALIEEKIEEIKDIKEAIDINNADVEKHRELVR